MLENVVAGAISGVVWAAINGVGQRVASKFIKTPAEKAAMAYQTATIDHNKSLLELRKIELEQKERHFFEQLAIQRKNQLDLAEVNFLYLREGQQLQHQLNQWPFKITPRAFLNASQARQGRMLNVVVALRKPRSEASFTSEVSGKSLSYLTPTIDLVRLGMGTVSETLHPRFKNTLRIYDETDQLMLGASESIRVNAWDMWKTEPTAFVYIEPANPVCYKIDISLWGLAFNAEDGVSITTTVTVDLKPYISNRETRAVALICILESIVTALGDSYRTTHFPHLLPEPVLPLLIADAKKRGVPEATWTQAVEGYMTALESVMTHSPLLAAEIAAIAALQAHKVELAELSATLFAKAMVFYEKSGQNEAPENLAQAHMIFRSEPLPVRERANILHDYRDGLPSLEEKTVCHKNVSPEASTAMIHRQLNRQRFRHAAKARVS